MEDGRNPPTVVSENTRNICQGGRRSRIYYASCSLILIEYRAPEDLHAYHLHIFTTLFLIEEITLGHSLLHSSISMSPTDVSEYRG